MGVTLDLYILDIEEYNPLNFYGWENEIDDLYSYSVMLAKKFDYVVQWISEDFLTEDEMYFIRPQDSDDIEKLEDYKHYDPVKFKDIMIKIIKLLKIHDLETYKELKKDMVNLIKLVNKAIKLNKPLGWTFSY